MTDFWKLAGAVAIGGMMGDAANDLANGLTGHVSDEVKELRALRAEIALLKSPQRAEEQRAKEQEEAKLRRWRAEQVADEKVCALRKAEAERLYRWTPGWMLQRLGVIIFYMLVIAGYFIFYGVVDGTLKW